jgi:ribosomal protein L37AE/L43A
VSKSGVLAENTGFIRSKGEAMSKGSVRSIARALHFECRGDIAFGVYEGIFANITHSAYTGAFIFTISDLQPEALAALKQFIGQNRKALLVDGNAHADKSFISVKMNSHYGAYTVKRAVQSFKQIAAFLEQYGAVSACENCGTKEASPAAAISRVHWLCDDCYEKMEAKNKEALDGQNTQRGFARGLWGAIGGAALGLIPWVVLGLLNMISALSGIVMAVILAYVFKKSGGKATKAMIAMVLLILAVFTALGVSLGYTAHYLADGYDDFHVIMANVFSNLTLDGITFDFIKAYVLAGLAGFAMMQSMAHKEKGRDLHLERIRLPADNGM